MLTPEADRTETNVCRCSRGVQFFPIPARSHRMMKYFRTSCGHLVLQPHLETSDPALVVEPAGAGLVAAAPV
jgi:hypothetical protein